MHALIDFATKFHNLLGGVLGWVIGWVLGLLFQQHPPQWKHPIYWHSDKLGLLLVLFCALPREIIFPALGIQVLMLAIVTFNARNCYH